MVSSIRTLGHLEYDHPDIDWTLAKSFQPSDSFPGTIAKYTGASPRTHGIWYDDVWDWTYYDPGTNCQGKAGAEVQFAENVDYNSSLLWSGGIDPANLPLTVVDGKCVSVYPHQRVLTNTVFELLTAAGLQSAYVDKHPAYDLVNGPSGKGMTTGYFPEINAIANTVNATIAYDTLHVNAWLNYIDGVTPANSTYGTLSAGQMPSFFGGNFQSVSVAQKTVGYNKDLSFSSNLTQAFDFVDTSIGKIVAKLKQKNYLNDTLIIVASKHGQAPINPALFNEVDPDNLTAATGVPTTFVTTDDIGLFWLNSTNDIPTAAKNLQAQAAALHIQEVIYGDALIQQGFGNPLTSPRVPHIIVRPTLGTVYSTSKKKIAEHGGLSSDDRLVACFVSNPNLQKAVVKDMVETKQVAPTILKALGLDPNSLEGVVAEQTQPLSQLFA